MNKKITNYRILYAKWNDIGDVVCRWINAGWQPLGGPFKDDKDLIGQAMICYDSDSQDINEVK